ncbi:MAG: phosphate ABC transporter substrate-binding protein PstS [Archaeoglobaceae archaeon]|nr:phosphate ABC transporter substrate-binding protein PstS [Archaeoglobaceae archaeon]MCX8152381.1 phosphate ABC transporter substrate-binding protein PstS [Archaeoglobaceae archaeon]MDW8013721.1 phosphate ABC transporter substrate-binding protein PstS [Archaeoglobaceae archaeon]
MKKVVIALVLILVLSNCLQQPQQQQKEIIIYGSGATFPQPQIEKWISEYGKINRNIKIEYAGKGSGAGLNDFKEGLVDFACTDPPVSEKMWRELEKKGQILQFPIIIGAVVVIHNVPEVDGLKLDGKTLAEIFMGKIEYWDDEKIKALNPNKKLPHERIIVVYRSDSSGTTEVFTAYLSLSSEEFKKDVGIGKLVDWPVAKVGRGIGGKGNPGVAAAVKNTPYSIGYVELAFALKENFKTIALKNKDGKFVNANAETISSAIKATSVFVPEATEGYKEDLFAFINAPGEKSYPIVSFSHVVIWQSYPKDKSEAIKSFFKWVLTDGQKHVIEGYVAVPEEVAKVGLRALEKVKGT